MGISFGASVTETDEVSQLASASSPEVRNNFDIHQHTGLIILDGLERGQESGVQEGLWRIHSSSLRELLSHFHCLF